jgi:hypothetical protein
LGRPLSLVLAFPPDAFALAQLPWELIWDEGPTPMLLSRGMRATCIRRLDLAQALPPPVQHNGPLRILAISPRAGIEAELRQVERSTRTSAFQPLITSRRAVIRDIEPADPGRLARIIQRSRPDIVHYYGHGRHAGGDGALLLDSTGNSGTGWVPAEALATIFSGVGMVVLHACQGAAVGAPGPGDGLLTGVAPALCAAGVPVVLGMQFTVRAEAAARMAAVIYGALATGRSVQEGLALARQVLYAEEPDRVSWYVPTLYIRARKSGPIYLRKPATNEKSATGAAPTRPARQGAQQSIVADGGSTVSGVQMNGREGSQQQIRANNGGRIQHIRMDDQTGEVE